MKIRRFLIVASLLASLTSCKEKCPADKEVLQPVSFENVSLSDNFWLPRLITQKKTLVPYSLQNTAPAVENLRRTAEYLKTGKAQKLLPLPFFVDSDLFKAMEGAAYLLKLEPDPALEKQMDEIIDIIAAAQKEDGYLYEIFEMPKEMSNISWNTGNRPYSFLVHSHELYNMGHMYEGAIAYYRATGKRKWLDVAEKSAHHINKVIFEGDPNYNDGKPVNQAPGHEEIEIALVKLYQTTGNQLYLDMAQKFIDIRGVTYKPDGEGIMSPEYGQQHLPVREQFTAEGHSVRAMYLFSAMADIMAQKNDTTLRPALESVWHNFVDKKMHINGGLGAVPGIEGFGPDYELPNKDTYDETCAGVGNVLFNYRMFLGSKEAKYVDVAEVALYNNVLAGVNIEGNRFFYVNVLEADGRKAFNHGTAGRAPWFGTACCPTNMARLIPQVPGMVYSHTSDDIYCAFYASSKVNIPLKVGNVGLKQESEYPFDGNIRIEVSPEVEDTEFTLWLRIPTWSTDRFVPGELYHYGDKVKTKAKISINGKSFASTNKNGYFPIKRRWSAGDVVKLELPMDLRYSFADERVAADTNRVCVSRGPLIYCAEAPDNTYPAPNYIISSIKDKGCIIDYFNEGILKGIPAITINAEAVVDEEIVKTPLKLIPYYAWNNRGNNVSMNVWFAQDKQTVESGLVKLANNMKGAKATYTNADDDVLATIDGLAPTKSNDRTISRWTSLPKLGESQSLEIELKEEKPVKTLAVYWYNDNGEVRLPASWSVEYRLAGEWKVFELYNTDAYGLRLDQFNVIHPASTISADAIRINIVPQKNAAVGILEVEID